MNQTIKEKTMTDHTETYKVYQDLKDLDELEDVASFTSEQLALRLILTLESATLLHKLVEDHMDQGPHWDVDPVLLTEALGEAEHQSYDGWSDSDKVVIMSFMADIRKALKYI